MKKLHLLAVMSTAIWIAGWTARWKEPDKKFPHWHRTHSQEFSQEFQTKEEASQFLARCADCDPVGAAPDNIEDICCDNKTLHELHK